MSTNININDNEELHSLLIMLHVDDCFEHGLIDDFVHYNKVRKILIDTLSSDINIAISFFKSLDLNKYEDSYIMHLVNEINEKLKTQKDKDDFHNLINSLSEKFDNSPYINWGFYRFYNMIESISKDIDKEEEGEGEEEEDDCYEYKESENQNNNKGI